MENTHNKLLCIHQETFEELYLVDTFVQLTRTSCQECEFKGEYYGITDEMSKKLSAERNNYINMLSVIADKISNIMDLNLSLEKEIMLQQNSNNCG